LFAIGALGVIVLAVLGNQLRVSYRTPLSGCASDDGTGGASGLLRWAGRLGIPARTLAVPIWEAAGPLVDPVGNCVITMGNNAWSPTGEDLQPASWQTARAWLARGNTLVVVTGAPRSLSPALRRDLIPGGVQETREEPAIFFGDIPVESRPATSQATLKSGGSLTVDAKGPRWSIASSRRQASSSSASAPTPRAQDDGPAGLQLAGDGRGGVLFRIPIGQGAVYILLDEFAWTNSGIDHGDNARVLADLLGREIRGGVLALDEYRHGHGRTESFLVYLANSSGSSVFAFCAGIWGLLFFYGRNVRLAPAQVYVERERRTAQEYIDAVAQLYERARAAPLVVEAVARRLRQVSRSSAEPSSPVEALLKRAEDTTGAGERPASPTAAIHLVREIIQLRKRIYGTRTVS
jgi:hypothetical protein